MGWQVTLNGTKRVLTEEQAKDPYASSWEGGTVVNLDDFSPAAWDEIASRDGETHNWWGCYAQPGATSARLYAVICAAAAHAEVDAPPPASNMREARVLIEMVEQTQNIEDKPFTGDFPPTPSETETG